MARRKNNIFPIPIPDGCSLPMLGPMHQGSTNACTVFSVVYGLRIMYHLRGLLFDLDPLEVHKAILLQYYDNYDPRKSVSYKQTFKWLKKHHYIWRKRPVQNIIEDYKIKIFQGYPVYLTLKRHGLLHAVCAFQYDNDIVIYHDSNSKSYPLKQIEDFGDVQESFLTIL